MDPLIYLVSGIILLVAAIVIFAIIANVKRHRVVNVRHRHPENKRRSPFEEADTTARIMRPAEIEEAYLRIKKGIELDLHTQKSTDFIESVEAEPLMES